MSPEQHYRKLEKLYHGAPINQFFAPSLRVSDGEAEIRVAVRDEFMHAAEAVHGSVYFKMLDDAAFFAVNSRVHDVLVLTASFNLYLLRPIATGSLRAVGRSVHSTTRTHLGEAELFDEDERLIARGSGSFTNSRIALTPEIGYI